MYYASYEALRYNHQVADIASLNLCQESSFHPNKETSWIEATNLKDFDKQLVPFELVHTNFTEPRIPGFGAFISSSNGLASGNCYLEAILHGIYEIVERDQITLWLLRDKDTNKSSRIKLSTIEYNPVTEIINNAEARGLYIAIWDISSDIGLPCFACTVISSNDHHFGNFVTSGYGCHTDKNIALSRAVTEAFQSRLTMISGARDDNFWDQYEEVRNINKNKRTIDAIVADPESQDFSKIKTSTYASLNEEFNDVLYRLRIAGFKDVFVTDLGKKEFNILIVRIIIPGLEYKITNPKYAPGKRARALLN